MKHRLAGAAVLIAFAVIVLPMLLGGPREADRGADNVAESRESDTKVFRSNITPIGGATPGGPAGDGDALERTVDQLLNPEGPPSDDRAAAEDIGAATTGNGDGDQATDETESEASRVASRDHQGGEPEPAEPEQAAAPAEVERGWIVQVGTFTKAGNADKLVSDLEERGYMPSTTDVDLSSGRATRVWVGPFETRVEAARVKSRVTQQTGSEALIVAYP